MTMKNEVNLSREAVEEINDVQYLLDIALGEKDNTIRNAAIEKLNALKEHVTIDLYNDPRFWSYDESDEPAIDEGFYNSERYQDNPHVRIAAVASITNEEILISIACKDPCYDVSAAAINKITNTSFLESLRRYDRISDGLQMAAGKRLCEIYDVPLTTLEEEWISIFDESYHHIGAAPRSIAHKNGLWHQTFHCWFMEKETVGSEQRVYLWFQQRSSKKKDYPDLLDITAAGHLSVEEGVYDGIREIHEELGFDISYKELIPLGVRINVEHTPSLFNNEFNEVYLYDSPYSMKDVNFKDGEVQGIFRISAAEGIKLFRGEIDLISAVGYTMKDGIPNGIGQIVSIDSFVPRPVDSYYLKMCIIADLIAKGYPNVAI